jgi:hypothetical protein
VLLSDESASGQSGITIMASVAPENIPAGTREGQTLPEAVRKSGPCAGGGAEKGM